MTCRMYAVSDIPASLAFPFHADFRSSSTRIVSVDDFFLGDLIIDGPCTTADPRLEKVVLRLSCIGRHLCFVSIGRACYRGSKRQEE